MRQERERPRERDPLSGSGRDDSYGRMGSGTAAGDSRARFASYVSRRTEGDAKPESVRGGSANEYLAVRKLRAISRQELSVPFPVQGRRCVARIVLQFPRGAFTSCPAR